MDNKSQQPPVNQPTPGFNQPPPYYDQPGFQPGQPPAGHYPPQIVQNVVVTAPRVGPDPVGIICPSCHHQIITRLDYETTTKTHLMAALLCLFVCWPCAWIPYVMDSCKNANHYCPSCGAFIGTYKN